MAITITNIEEYIAAGDIYVDAVVPAPLASVGDTLSPDGVPSGGVHVGATSGESVFRYEASIETVDIEQSTFPVAPFVTSESATLEFTVAEATAENIKRAIGQTFLRNVASGKLMSFGGLTAVTGTSVCIVAPKKKSPGKFVGVMIYNAYSDGGLERRFKRGEATLVSMTLRGVATSETLNRPEGDQLGQYFETT